MGYFQVRYDSRVVNYDRRGFIRLATENSLLGNMSNFEQDADTCFQLSQKNLLFMVQSSILSAVNIIVVVVVEAIKNLLLQHKRMFMNCL